MDFFKGSCSAHAPKSLEKRNTQKHSLANGEFQLLEIILNSTEGFHIKMHAFCIYKSLRCSKSNIFGTETHEQIFLKYL